MSRAGTAVVALVVVAGAVAAGYAIRTASEPEPVAAEAIATDSVGVIRTDLVQFESLAGTLGYTDERELRSAAPGTVTSLPAEASRLERGDVAFEIDGRPVFVMIGDRPAWRLLADGAADGVDVKQVESNLAGLGFGPDDWEPDQEFDGDTGDAIEAWRDDVGLPEGDSLELGTIVFVPAPVRVGAHRVAVGEQVPGGAPVFAVTGFDQEVVIDLDPDDVELVAVGGAVTVVLPDDREVAGEIVEVGRVVVPGGGDPDSPGVLEVRVSLADGAEIDLDQAPVDIEVESERAVGVLAVPVRALIALSDGGYAVDVDGRLIGVEVGDFAGGLVEVEGALAEGDMVVVPR